MHLMYYLAKFSYDADELRTVLFGIVINFTDTRVIVLVIKSTHTRLELPKIWGTSTGSTLPPSPRSDDTTL